MVLVHDADSTSLLEQERRGRFVEDPITQADRPRVDPDASRDAPKKRRLARTVGSQHRGHRCSAGVQGDLEIEVAE